MKKSALLLAPALAYLLYKLNPGGNTSPIEGENSISEFKKININNTSLAVMIRGLNRNNPILLCVSGGPSGTDIPFIRKYDKELEKYFTVIHYDQRGAGKSFYYTHDYSNLSAKDHVDDLIELSKYLLEYLNQDKLFILGHSYGTYLASLAIDKRPDLYKAYIGIGQMSDTKKAEYYSLLNCLDEAKKNNNEFDYKYLYSIKDKVEKGEMLTPRSFVRKYKFASRNNNINDFEMMKDIIMGPEYNILDGIRFYSGAISNSYNLATEAIKYPLSDLIKEVKIPTYILMGKYDGMTNTKAAKEYFDNLKGDIHKEFIIFENSAHSPHIEENEKFIKFMKERLL